MYGFKRPDGSIWCEVNQNAVTASFYQPSRNKIPIVKMSAHEADIFHQRLMVNLDDYSIVVHKFTKEEEADLIIRKLRGY